MEAAGREKHSFMVHIYKTVHQNCAMKLSTGITTATEQEIMW